MRTELVKHIRQQIEQGSYVTPGKLAITRDRILEELLGDVMEAPPEPLLRSKNDPASSP